MLSFLSTFTNTNLLAFPNTAAVNSSGGSATDGTEFIASMVNDSMWGWQQALLDYVGITPSGVVESASASQILEALTKFKIPGEVFHAAWNDDPATLGIRALQMTGQGILRANYTELDTNVYCGDANNATASAFFRADDSAGTTRNTAGVYLILPDARGRVFRTLDLTGSVDPDGASRDQGSLQADAMQECTGIIGSFTKSDYHYNLFHVNNLPTISGVYNYTDSNYAGNNRIPQTLNSGNIGDLRGMTFALSGSTSPNIAKTDDVETRTINIAFNGYIAY